ncbi:MAG: hypothetical protein ACLPJH_08885 [Myxococcaceae bacterium]
MKAVFQWLLDGFLNNPLLAMIACPLLISAFAFVVLAYVDTRRSRKHPRPIAE